MSPEERIMNLLRQQNKPFSVQLTADFLAQYGVKKGQVQKGLDSLAEAGKITIKEFGKTKIYMPVQAALKTFTKEESDACKLKIEQLGGEAKAAEETVGTLRKELGALQSCLTFDEIQNKISTLSSEVGGMEKKIKSLKESTVLITAEEKTKIEKGFVDYMSHWRKRKAIFKEVWNNVSENLDRKTSEVYEEIGVETDETCQCSFEELSRLMPKRRRI